MLVACLQFAPEFGAPQRNVERAAELIRGAGADLVVLPELATTGYQFADPEEARSLAEPVPDGPSTEIFVRLAREEGTHICFGLAEQAGDRLFISSVLAGPEGVLLLYRKVHLFADERDIFDPGDLGFPVAHLPGSGARVGMMICFDWVYPEASRILALEGADVILHPSNLVLPYCQRAMVTRSLENGVFTVTANRTGSEARAGKDPLRFRGESQIVSPRGEVLASLGDGEGIARAEIDPARARDKRLTPRNSLLADRRPDLYGRLTETGVRACATSWPSSS